MNKRIRELITQAGGHWNHGDFNMPSSVEFQEQDIAKFAELIVRECAGACLYDDWEDPRWGRFYANKIQEHFGVES